MNFETFKKDGVYFDYCRYAVVSEMIPHVQDVLFAMRLSEQEENYTFCVNNHATATYVVNVALVVVAVGYRVLCMEPYDEAKAKRIIAKAIVDLCPEEARCLFNTAFVKAKIMAGQDNWEVALTSCPEILRQTCLCLHCQQDIEERQTAA